MHVSGRLYVHRPPAAAFDSFFHRQTPRWHNRGALMIAFAAATISGCTILLSALTLLA